MDMEGENLSEGIRSVVLRRGEVTGMGVGLGFSIMGGAGYDFPPVIYGIEKDSPAARCGLLEAGDIILSINEREVVRLSTKEVLKCLRLSGDIVHIKFKRDPHIVSRVRQFLSTPNVIESQENTPYLPQQYLQHLSPSASPRKQAKTKVSHIPVYQFSSSQPRSTPNSRFSGNNKVGCVKSSPTSGVTPTTPDSSSGQQISFSDDLFINHGHNRHHSSSDTSTNPKTPNTPFREQTAVDIKNGRKHCEAFVMTGDAILNLSKNNSNDAFKASPTKTTSKLTPMPQMPVFVEREKDFERRLQLGRNLEKEMKEAMMSTNNASSHPSSSPPLPPPPSELDSFNKGPLSQQNSVDLKTEDFSLPPYPVVEETNAATTDQCLVNNCNQQFSSDEAHSAQQNNGTHQVVNGSNNNNNNNMVGATSEENSSNSDKVDACAHGRGSNNNKGNGNNNEDTSISSSVMSDSGDDEDDQIALIETDEEEGDDDSKKSDLVMKMAAKKPKLLQHKNGESRKSKIQEARISSNVCAQMPERERYNEYILLNGSPGTIPDDDGSDQDRTISNHSSPSKGGTSSTTPITSIVNPLQYQHSLTSGDEDVTASDEGDGENCNVKTTKGDRDSGGSNFSGGESDSSDVESVRLAPVVKGVDLPSAERLAKRLFALDGFKVSDVWRQLSKSNDFSRAVATEYLKFFDFKDESLDISLRNFLSVCPLRGETQERERVLSYFSTRYVECNPNSFGSQDSVHTLACALMLLNTDLYSGVRSGRRMTCLEFIENLSGLNDGGDFPKNILKQLYHSIKSQPLVFSIDSEDESSTRDMIPVENTNTTSNVEFKRGYLMRKSVFEFGGKRTPLGKRSWKMCFFRLKEIVCILSPDENSKPTMQNTHQIKLHHAIAAVASDYKKRPNVFRLTLADRSQYLFQCSDLREMNSWIDMINWNAAKFSSPALEAPCSSSGRFEKPLLPSSVSRMTSREQLNSHQTALNRWNEELELLKREGKGKRDTKEKQIFFQYEIRRYRAYIDVLSKRVATEGNDGSSDELVELQVLPNPPSILLEMEDENN